MTHNLMFETAQVLESACERSADCLDMYKESKDQFEKLYPPPTPPVLVDVPEPEKINFGT